MPLERHVRLEWAWDIQADLNQMLFDVRIDDGATREVYVYRPDPTLVIKVEQESTFHNVREHDIWFVVKGTKWAKWFAPVRNLSPLGRALLMARTRPWRNGDPMFPRRIPDVFVDVRRCNWGILNGRWVCHDYGYSRVLAHGIRDVALIKTVMED